MTPEDFVIAKFENRVIETRESFGLWSFFSKGLGNPLDEIASACITK
jgi:hypothetical protein